MADIRVKFVSQKISKLRWRPTINQSLPESDVFASGNWDDEEHKVSLWQIPSADFGDLDEDLNPPDREPVLLCETAHDGDVTGLEFTGANQIVTSSSTGSVTLLREVTPYDQSQERHPKTLMKAADWLGIHHGLSGGRCACTCVATQGDDMIVSCGEDGQVNVLNVSHDKPVRTMDHADSCCINGITFLKQLEVLTVNSSGQLKIFDLRQPAEKPANIFCLSGDQTALHCVAKHPSQLHIVATGGHDGVLSLWDLRQDKFPVTLLEAHSSAMWEVKFHPTNPDHLFTCSEDGSVWHWDASSVSSLVTGTGAGSGGGSLFTQHVPGGRGTTSTGSTTPWLSLDSVRHKLEITTLLPCQTLSVNSLDILSQTLICGNDEEAIYTVDIPGIR